MFQNLSGYLARFKTIFQTPNLLKHEVILAIQEHTALEFLPSEIKIDRGIIRVTSSPAARSEVILKKGAILRSLRDRGISKDIARDIL